MKLLVPFVCILFSGCHRSEVRSQTDAETELAGAVLAALDQRVANGDIGYLYGCEPEEWKEVVHQPESLVRRLGDLGNQRAAVEPSVDDWNRLFMECHTIGSPSSCCEYAGRQAMLRSMAGETPQYFANTINSEFVVACALAPRGGRTVRGCLNFVALNPLTDSPLTTEERLQIVRETLLLVERGEWDQRKNALLQNP